MRRFVYLRNTPCMWCVIDTGRTPGVVACLVPEPNTDATESADAARICDVLNRDHEMSEQVAAATRRKES